MKILIVDSSVPFRLLLRACLSEVPDTEIVGVAGDGQQALDLIRRLQPDLITLNMKMPGMDGIEILQLMRDNYPDIKVVVVACRTETDAEKTLQAMELGAFDFILKPDDKVADTKAYLQLKLLPKIKQARSLKSVSKRVHIPVKVASTPVNHLPEKSNRIPASGVFKADIVAIGSSTGGPAALQEVLSQLPENFAVPIVVTQHMPKAFVVSLASRLNKNSSLVCTVAEQGQVLQLGHIYMAPGDVHMKIIRRGSTLVAQLEAGARVNHAIPSVDVTYESLVALSPAIKTLAVVLTGMGNDGAKGAKLLSEKGNHVVIQNEESSVVWGMAGETFRNGAANEVLPLADISKSLLRHVA
ncbi:MAG: chemotaxis-specific protein-glutamate methyltransferase CheB [Ghiorsea sp.]|nr:chemotaxis-specific protein-glutamate methyltransferase CheB [Ghiorsea sp.]MDQ7057969.1 chemotaxis-specific protein-glutamate methyltransferase CheB [Ghiorsea sp.]